MGNLLTLAQFKTARRPITRVDMQEFLAYWRADSRAHNGGSLVVPKGANSFKYAALNFLQGVERTDITPADKAWAKRMCAAIRKVKVAPESYQATQADWDNVLARYATGGYELPAMSGKAHLNRLANGANALRTCGVFDAAGMVDDAPKAEAEAPAVDSRDAQIAALTEQLAALTALVAKLAG